MTDQEKLQKLFDAALRDSSPVEKAPTRAVPMPSEAPKAAPQSEEKTAAAPVAVVSDSTRQTLAAEPAFDKTAAEQLGVLLDEQIRRKKRMHRTESLVTAIVLVALTGGSGAWFVQSPDRVHAFVSAIAEIRSVGDVKSMVAKYDAALERVSSRGQQIDEASKAMGITSNGKDEKDPYFDAEMKQMMGDEGKTMGDRAGRMQQAFGEMQEEHGDSDGQVVNVLDEENSFGW